MLGPDQGASEGGGEAPGNIIQSSPKAEWGETRKRKQGNLLVCSGRILNLSQPNGFEIPLVACLAVAIALSCSLPDNSCFQSWPVSVGMRFAGVECGQANSQVSRILDHQPEYLCTSGI